jgi:hypothetical protein
MRRGRVVQGIPVRQDGSVKPGAPGLAMGLTPGASALLPSAIPRLRLTLPYETQRIQAPRQARRSMYFCQ